MGFFPLYLIRSYCASQEWFVLIFLEGLLNENLHFALYMKHHKDFNLYMHEAIDYDDSWDWGTYDTNSNTSSSSRQMASQVEKIIRGVLEKMQ